MSAVRRHRIPRLNLAEVMVSSHVNEAAIQAEYSPEARLAQPHSVLDNRIEDRLQARRRLANYAKDFTRRRFSVQCLSEALLERRSSSRRRRSRLAPCRPSGHYHRGHRLRTPTHRLLPICLAVPAEHNRLGEDGATGKCGETAYRMGLVAADQ